MYYIIERCRVEKNILAVHGTHPTILKITFEISCYFCDKLCGCSCEKAKLLPRGVITICNWNVQYIGALWCSTLESWWNKIRRNFQVARTIFQEYIERLLLYAHYTRVLNFFIIIKISHYHKNITYNYIFVQKMVIGLKCACNVYEINKNAFVGYYYCKELIDFVYKNKCYV